MRERRNEERNIMEIDLQKLLMAYLRKWWLIVLCGCLAAGVAFVYTKCCITPMFRASVTIYVNNTRSGEYVDYVSGSNLSASKQLVRTYVNIIESDTVLSKVIETSGLEMTPSGVRGVMSASQVDDTELFKVYISHPDPQKAADIANAIAKVAPGEIEEFVEGSSTKIVDYAKVPSHRYSPSYTNNVLVGGIVGALLAVVYITVMSLLDVRIKSEDDLNQMYDYPILGLVPSFDKVDSGRSGYGKRAYEVQSPKSDERERR